MSGGLVTIRKSVENKEIAKRTAHTAAIVVKDALELTMPKTKDGDRYIALGTYRRTINIGHDVGPGELDYWSIYIFFRSLELSGIIYAKEGATACSGRVWLPTTLFEHYFVPNPRTRHWGLRMSSLEDLWVTFGKVIMSNRIIAEQEVLAANAEEADSEYEEAAE